MSIRRLSLLLALLLALSACAAPAPDTGPFLWYAGDLSDWSDFPVAAGQVPYTGPLEVEPLLEALFSGQHPEGGLHSPFPAGARALGWTLEDGLLSVDLSAPYGTLEGFDLTLANYCLVLTLVQVPGVERVKLTVEGRPLGGDLPAELSPDQVLLSGAEERPVEVYVDLYFPRAAGRGLGLETRVFLLTEGDVLAEEVMKALLAGPADQELSSAIPEGTELRSVHLEDTVCYVDFSHALLDGLPAGEDAQTLLIFSIVNTLGNLNSVSSVCLQAEGETLTRLGEVDLPASLEPDFGLAVAASSRT